MFHIKLKDIRNRGFTLIELLVVVAIISLLSSVVMASLNSARSKAQFTRAIETMSNMEKAAILDYYDYGNYAPDVSATNILLGTVPRFVPKYLPNWTTPPCSGWLYDWENWPGYGGIIRVSLRRADLTTAYYYCIYDPPVNCGIGGGSDIKTVTNKTLTCNE